MAEPGDRLPSLESPTSLPFGTLSPVDAFARGLLCARGEAGMGIQSRVSPHSLEAKGGLVPLLPAILRCGPR